MIDYTYLYMAYCSLIFSTHIEGAAEQLFNCCVNLLAFVLFAKTGDRQTETGRQGREREWERENTSNECKRVNDVILNCHCRLQ